MRVVEVVVQCIKCLTFETLYFWGRELEPTRRYRQVDGQVYHDCGSMCKLFPRWLKWIPIEKD